MAINSITTIPAPVWRDESQEKTSSRKTHPNRRERGTGHLFLRGKVWWIQYMHRGRVHRESSHTTKRTVAERKLRRRLGELQYTEFLGPKVERVRYEDLAADLLQYYLANGKKCVERTKDGRVYIGSENHLRKAFSGYRAIEISTDRIREYVRARLRAGARNATINRSLAMLKLMFNLAVRARKLRQIDVPVIELLQERNVRKGFLEHDQYLQLRKTLPDYLQPMLTMGYFTGMRLGEIRNLKWNQVNLVDAQVSLFPGETKNDEGRTIPLVAELLEVLKSQRTRRDMEYPDCDFVFFRRGKRIGDFRKAWGSACARAGLGKIELDARKRSRKYKGLLFHDLRRSAVRNLVRAGVPERVAMAISGHKSRRVFDRYNIVSDRDVLEAGEKLETYLAGRKGG